MQLFSADAMVFSKKNFNFFWTRKSEKNRPKKLLIIGPGPFLSQSSPDQWATAQNWFFILWNVGTRHLFSYLCLWPRALLSILSLNDKYVIWMKFLGVWLKLSIICLRCPYLNLTASAARGGTCFHQKEFLHKESKWNIRTVCLKSFSNSYNSHMTFSRIFRLVICRTYVLQALICESIKIFAPFCISQLDFISIWVIYLLSDASKHKIK